MAGNRTSTEPPGFCKAEDLANLFALSGPCIRQLTRDGVLKKHDTPAGRRYHVVESTRAYVRYLREQADAHKDSRERELLDTELRIRRAKAQIAEQEAQELQGWPF